MPHVPHGSARYRRRAPQKTALFHLVREHLSTFREQVERLGGGLPGFVLRALGAFLGCGILANGFNRLRCRSCKAEHRVAFSCKGRGMCPSCGGKRMQKISDHLLSAVLPVVPVRQWVFTYPFRLRYRMAFDRALASDVHRVAARAVHRHYRAVAKREGHGARAVSGSVTFVQRFGSALNLNVHFHLLAIDGVFLPSATERRGLDAFVALPAPTSEEMRSLLNRVGHETLRVLARHGLLDEEVEDPIAERYPGLAACYGAAVRGRVALGPRRGSFVRRIGQLAFFGGGRGKSERIEPCLASAGGFDIECGVRVDGDERAALGRLIRYAARPPICNERLELLPDGTYKLTLKRPFRDGTSAFTFQPLELMERIAALIPRPHANQVLYHGVLAANSRHRAAMVASAAGVFVPTAEQGAPVPKSTVASAIGPADQVAELELGDWARFMRSSFGLDVLACLECGGRLRFIAHIQRAQAIQAILDHAGEDSTPEVPSAPRDPPPGWPEEASWAGC